MERQRFPSKAGLLVLLLGIPTQVVWASEPLIDQVIVQLKPNVGAASTRPQAMTTTLMQALAAKTASNLRYKRAMANNKHVLKLPRPMTATEAQAYAKTLAQQADVALAEPDYVMYPTATPNDPHYAWQWGLQSVADYAGAANLPLAWDLTTGANSITVAVLDTGILSNHPDLTSRLVAGYDFVSDPTNRDGDGIDNDPSDPGDWTVDDQGTLNEPSSWHGSHVAGVIGAMANNSTGVGKLVFNLYEY